MKLLLKIIAVLVILIIIAVVAGFLYIDAVAKAGIERGATYALGVETKLDSADVGVFSGEFAMSGLNVSNPEGFDTQHFLHLDDGAVSVSLGTLREDVIELPTLTLTGLDINLEKKQGKANYQVILDNLKRLESGDKPKDESGEGKDLIIREIIVKDVQAHIDLLPIGGELSRIEVPIDEIRLTDVGTGEGGALKFSQLAGLVLKAVFSAIVANGADLPGEVLGELTGGLSQLSSLGDMGVGMMIDIGGGLEDITGQLDDLIKPLGDIGDIIEGAGEGLEGVGEIGDDLLGGLGGLLGGGEEEKDQDDE